VSDPHPGTPIGGGGPLAWVVRHRAWIDRLLLWGGVAAAAVVAITGVATGHARFLTGYVAPFFLAGPLWLRLRLRSIESTPPAATWLDAAVFALAALRSVPIAVGILPYSGHMLFVTYAVAVTPERGFRAVAAVLLLTTTAFKLWIWRDPASWAWGLGMGITAALLRARLAARDRRRIDRA
jgi:hypothetical protein